MRKIFPVLITLLLLTLPAAAQDAGDSIAILFPLPVYEVAGTVDVVGTVNAPDILSYFVEYALYNEAIPEDETTWLPLMLPANTPVTEGVIVAWDTTTVPDGLYQLRMQVVMQSGQTETVMVSPLRVANQAPPVAAAPVQPDSSGQTGGDSSGAGALTPVPLAAVTAAVPPVQPTATEVPPPTATPEPTRPPRPNPVNDLPIPLGGHISGFNDDTIPLIRDAGLTWIKWQVPFVVGDSSLIDVAEDRIDWTHERGFKVFLSIKGNKDELAAIGAEDYFPQYAEFVGRVASRQPDAIQVWNEMNLDREWPNGQIDPAMYVELLRQSYEAIKEEDSEVMVVTGAPAPTGAEGAFGLDAVWNDDRYYLGMANAGAADVSDCIGIHYNEGIIPPRQQGGDPRDNDYPTRYLPLMLQRAAFPFRNTDAHFCFSELGYITPEGLPEPLPDSFSWGNIVSLEEQAEYLRDAIVVASESNVQVDLIIIWNLDFESIEGDPQAAYAIVRSDGSCPACETIATLREGQG